MLPPKDDLYEVFDESLPKLKEGDVVLVTSKVVAIHQGRCIPVSAVPNKDDLIKKEAESYIERDKTIKYPVMFTIKHHTLIASAGIDESNGNGYYILWPEHIDEAAKEIWSYLRKAHNVKKLGIIITDSHILPLRWGVTGISIGHYGFEPSVDRRGEKDVFGRKLTMTWQNIPDSIAAFGVMLMGEGGECTPLLVARGLPLTFTSRQTSQKFWADPREDIYKPLLNKFKKQKHG